MDLKKLFGIKHPVIDDEGRMHCHNCTADLTGQTATGNKPIICPACRAKNFPDLRGSSPIYRRR